MKHIWKKNQIIITALAIMLAVAGYLNFSKEDTLNTLDGDMEATSTYDENTTEDFGILDLSEEDTLAVEDSGEAVSEEVVATEGEAVADANDENVGEAVMVSNTISADYFASAKLQREQTRAKSKELLMEIVDNDTLSEAQKQDAIDGIEKLASLAEKESATEILLEAKGFPDSVVSIVDESVDVIVNANELTEQQMAQIEDIVKRKTEISAKNIVITPVGVSKN
ncbi:MAG: stage sporulation protein [Clostridiales bacterium]|nr:stage sporulation protein [Clostridiales bacterium]